MNLFIGVRAFGFLMLVSSMVYLSAMENQLLQLSSYETLKFRFLEAELDHFADKTGIIFHVAQQKMSALLIHDIIEVSLNNYGYFIIGKESNFIKIMRMRSDEIFNLITKDCSIVLEQYVKSSSRNGIKN